MSSNNNNVQKHNPIDSDKAKSEKKKKMIIWVVGLLALMAAVAYFYARTAVKGAEQLANSPAVSSEVSKKPASETAASQSNITLEESSPARVAIAHHEENQKTQAKEAGRTHIDSTNSLKEKTEKANAKKTPPKAKKNKDNTPKTSKTDNASKNEPKRKEPTPAEIRRKNMANLLKLPSYFPSSATGKKAEEYKTVLQKNYAELSAAGGTNEYTFTGKVEPRTTPPSLKKDVKSSETQLATRSESTSNKTSDKKQAQVKVAGSGDMVMCELRWEVNSDYKLPVFCDVVEPPLRPAIIVGSFEMTARQDGILLRGKRLEFDDDSVSINAYGVDIKTDTSPLFDNNYDSHFVQRTLARASAAFMVPFIDFVVSSSTTITDGNVVVTNPSISGTKDRFIGGAASVAKEFLPDLRKNANLPPTITIPNRYVVGFVMVSPVYSSSQDLAERSKSEPARATITKGN
ncbi:exported hypothetical protein [Vibrio nigripulchritudo SOn1]|uniref:Uncharacterized protein n=1 Tax=Vibrio nigripulchritudo SOn1 TaxID=1238450 RepID=A0AAV2VPZ2_9VIBR|nr:hypothetical protein [Vibrio nigripulchritudo]CCO46800.1 exported hypothetical protein [Vibrio nigripulchritudo SOn1]